MTRRDRIRRRRVEYALLDMLASGRTPKWLGRSFARVAVRTTAARDRGLGLLDAAGIERIAGDDRLRPLLGRAGKSTIDSVLIHEVLVQSELHPALIRHLQNSDPEAWSTCLYDVIVLDRAGGSAKVCGALALVGSLAGGLVPQQERAIFDRCVELLRNRPDPYSPSAGDITAAAREAAAALLATDAALDEPAGTALATGGAPLLRAAVASALKASGPDGPRRFLFYVRKLAPTAEALVRFAEDCDSHRSAADPPLRMLAAPPSLMLRARARIGPWAGLLAALCVGPALSVGLSLVLAHFDGRLMAVTIDPSIAIGALAVLAAVHVLAVQLAAATLPGVVAASAVAPPLLVTGYSLGVSMLVLTLLAGADPAPSWHPATVAAVVLIMFVIVVIVGTVSALTATGRARAAERAARRGRALAIRSGRSFDRMQEQGTALATVVENTPCLRSHISPDEASRRLPLRAERAGYLAVNVSRLTFIHLAPWRDGELHLDIFASPGRELSRGEEYAAIVPAPRATVADADRRRVSSAFSVERRPALGRFTELCTALTEQVVQLAQEGDVSSARRVMDSLHMLLGLHLHEAGSGSAKANPASPALLGVVSRLLVAVDTATDEAVRQLSIEAVTQILRSAGKSDPVIFVVNVRTAPRGHPTLSQLSLLYAAAQRAVALNSDSDVALIQRTLHGFASGDSESARYANETAGRVVQYSAVADPLHSRRAWTRWLRGTTAAPRLDRIMITARIGAAAWRVGNLSLAVEAALSLDSTDDLAALRVRIHETDTAERENMISRLFGRPLGQDAEERLDQWITAAEVFREAAASA